MPVAPPMAIAVPAAAASVLLGQVGVAHDHLEAACFTEGGSPSGAICHELDLVARELGLAPHAPGARCGI